MPRYILHPSHVRSNHDGDKHFINAEQLARLYGVDFKECIIVHEPQRFLPVGIRSKPDDEYLYVKRNGDYHNHRKDREPKAVWLYGSS